MDNGTDIYLCIVYDKRRGRLDRSVRRGANRWYIYIYISPQEFDEL